MSGYFTTNSLIADIKRRAMIPSAQNTFTNVDFLAFINSELKIGILPSVINVQEEFYVYPEEVIITSNKSSYSIPYRAVGGKLRDLFFKDSNGKLHEMSRISPDDKSMFQQNNYGSISTFYYVENNSIVLTPAIGSIPVGSLVFTFYMRPSDLVEESRVGIVNNIVNDLNLNTTTYTLSSIPLGMTINTQVDLLQAKPGHKIRKYDLLPSSINLTNKTITFSTSNIDQDMEIGDHVAFAGECIIPQCPSDLQTVLSQRAATRCLEALGDTQGLTNANTKLQEMEVKTLSLIDNRVDGSPKKIVNKRGLLRSSKIVRNRWY